MCALQLRVEPVDHDRPGRIAVDVRNVAAPAPLELVGQHVHETLRPAAERDHAGGNARRLGSDRDRSRTVACGQQQERIAARKAAQRTELVTGNEHQAWSYPAPAQIVEDPARGVGLVSEPDLDVFRIARHARVGHAYIEGRAGRELDRLANTSEARLPQSFLDSRQELGDPRFRRVPHPASGITSIFRRFRRSDTIAARTPRPRSTSTVASAAASSARVLGRRRVTPVEEVHSVLGSAEDFRAAVDAKVQGARPWGASSELPIDVADVGAGDDVEIEATCAQLLDEVAELAGIGLPVGHGGAIPVEDDRLEAAVQLLRRHESPPSPAFLGDVHSSRRAPQNRHLLPGARPAGDSRPCHLQASTRMVATKSQVLTAS